MYQVTPQNKACSFAWHSSAQHQKNIESDSTTKERRQFLFILSVSYIDVHSYVTIWYCRDPVSSCNIYAVQQDTQSVLMSEFYSALMLARHVSDLIGPSSGAVCTSCIRRFGMW